MNGCASNSSGELVDSLQALEAGLESSIKTPISEAEYHIRILGEFSAGKSLFLSEMLRHRVPDHLDHLLPESDSARETILPLEVTHGETQELSIIERKSDFTTDIQVVDTLDEFPTRDDLEGSGYSADEHRLRLTLEAPELVWNSDPGNPNGERIKTYLVDTRGFNAEEDEKLEFQLGDAPPAVVYVTKKHRLQSRPAKHFLLEELAEELAYAFPPNKKLTIIPVVTYWEEPEGSHDGLFAVLKQFERKLQGHDNLEPQLVSPFCINFGKKDDGLAVEQLRSQFWNLVGSLDPTDGPDSRTKIKSRNVAEHVNGWELTDVFQETADLLSCGEQLIDELGVPPTPFGSRNLTRLGGHPQRNHLKKLTEFLVVSEASLDSLESLSVKLPSLEGHPLQVWWKRHFVPTIDGVQRSLGNLVDALRDLPEQTLHGIEKWKEYQQDDVDVLDLEQKVDLNQWARSRIHEPFIQARENILAAHLFFPPQVRQKAREGAEESEILATMISAQQWKTPLTELANRARKKMPR